MKLWAGLNAEKFGKILVQNILPLIPGIIEKLHSGIDVLDIGCGDGCMHCMTTSLEQGGAGLGSMWGEQKALEHVSRIGIHPISLTRQW